MPNQQPVTVLGLGPMGTALARALLAAGVPTTVWNRTRSLAESLAVDGAAVADSVEEAVAAADLVIVCVRDHPATRDVLGQVAPAAFAGRTVVNLSSSTPDEARRTAEWAAERQIAYLSGAILVPTPLVGQPEALILYSGERRHLDRHVEQLRILAGEADHLGEDHGLASLYDVAMLEVFFTGMTAFIHAAAMTTAQDVDARTFLPYAQHVAALLPATFDGIASDIEAGTYPGTEDNLAMNLAGIEHIVDTSTEIGLDTSLSAAMRDLARRAVDAGHGADSYSRLIDTVRRR